MREGTMLEHTLILVRHAKSDWAGRHADVDRPLGERGRRQAPESGRWLAEHAPPIDLAVSSPAVRARSTWELVAAELPDPPPVGTDERVYSWSVEDLVEVVRGFPETARVVAMVGHNPGLEELVARLTGQSPRLPTSALAVVDLPVPWSQVRDAGGVLVAAGRPPEL
jgi:phosphohistidine phosphatase